MRASRAKVAGLHDTATITGTLLWASSRACASAPWRGGSNTTQSNGVSSTGTNGRRKRSRTRASTGFRPEVVAAARCRALTAAWSLSAAVTRARSARRNANGPTPANRSAIDLALPQCSVTSFANSASPAAVACRNAPGGSVTRARPIVTVGAARCATSSPWRVRRARRCALGEQRQRRGVGGGQRARAAHVDVEAGLGGGRLDVERLRRAGERFGDIPGGLDRAIEAGRKNRAAVDPDHVVRAQRGKADFENFARAAARMQHGAAAAVAVGVDQVADRRIEPGLAQRLDHQAALPGAVGRRRPVLHGAAAAGAEMRTDRRDALGARRVDGDQMTAVGMARPRFDLDGLARQRVGHVDRTGRRLRDAVAAMADLGDEEALHHAAW